MKIEAKQRLLATTIDQMTNMLKRNGCKDGPYFEAWQKLSRKVAPRAMSPLGLALMLANSGEDIEDALRSVHFGAQDKVIKQMIMEEVKT
jgi:hypothetical protein